MRRAGILPDQPTVQVVSNETTLCASLELSHKTWLLTVHSPGTQKDVEVFDPRWQRRCVSRRAARLGRAQGRTAPSVARSKLVVRRVQLCRAPTIAW